MVIKLTNPSTLQSFEVSVESNDITVIGFIDKILIAIQEASTLKCNTKNEVVIIPSNVLKGSIITII